MKNKNLLTTIATCTLALTLTGSGCFGGFRNTRQGMKQDATEIKYKTQATASALKHEVKADAREINRQAQEKASAVKEGVKKKAHEVGEKTQETLHEIKEKLTPQQPVTGTITLADGSTYYIEAIQTGKPDAKKAH